MSQKKLSDILVAQGLCSEKELELFISESSKKEVSLRQYVIEESKVEPEKLAHAYSKSLNIPYTANIDESDVSVELLGRISLKFLRDTFLFPYIDETRLKVLSADPLNYQALDELRLTLGRFELSVSTENFILETINRYYPLEGTKKVMEELEAEDEASPAAIDFDTISEEDIMGVAQEAPIIKLVNNILYQAVKRGASDIHIEPFEKELRVRYRIDGELYTVMSPPKRIQSALSSRLKIMSQLNIAEKRKPQDGRIQVKIANKPIDIRVSVLPVVYGERIVMRLLDKSRTFKAVDDIGFNERDLQVVQDGISQPNGIVLVTGPTGSGKTSTLYALLGQLNTPETSVITVEDPVEYQMMGIGQVQVREKIGLTFAAALRSILRQDPDIVMIGETRDQETAQIAIQAALTGHLVLSTLHTNSSAASVTRLVDMGIEPFLIASTLTVVIAQRLVRTLCEKCKESYTPTEEELRRLPGGGQDLKGASIYRAKGCSACMGSGYKGRMAIFEVMKMSPGIAALTLERATASKIEEVSRKEGMKLLVDDGISRIKEGLTTIEEVLAVAMSYEEPAVSDDVQDTDKEEPSDDESKTK